MSGPLRWKDQGSEADPELRAVIRHAGQQGPSDAELAALTERMRAQLSAGPAAAVASQTGATFTLKTAAVGLGLLLSGLGCWLVLSSHSSKLHSHAAHSATARGAPPSVQGAPYPARRAAPAESSDATPAVLNSVGAEPTEPVAAAPPARVRRRDALPRQLPARPVGAASDELLLLHDARQLAHVDPGGAIAAAREHERLYPEGVFREEREALLIELLWRTEQPAEGSARGAAFLRRYPDSAYGARVRRWLTEQRSSSRAGPSD